ncbi:hypothetical protein KVQ39_003611 [Vibrio cholerae]|nr:hypothetical protein [Vibrio cholerae]EJL6673786.1 hypothetical protein [Vibrio cholerae]
MDKQQIVDIVKEVIDYQLIDSWAYLILFICTGLGAYLGARIKKQAEITTTNNNFTTLLDQQKKLAKDIGDIKSELERSNIKYQIKLADYNAKSLESIELVYGKLVKIKSISRDLSYVQSPELAQDLYDSIGDFRSCFDLKRIWIPIELAAKIENVAIELGNKATVFVGVSISTQMSHRLTEAQVERVYSKQEEFYSYMSNDVTIVFDNLLDMIMESATE